MCVFTPALACVLLFLMCFNVNMCLKKKSLRKYLRAVFRMSDPSCDTLSPLGRFEPGANKKEREGERGRSKKATHKSKNTRAFVCVCVCLLSGEKRPEPLEPSAPSVLITHPVTPPTQPPIHSFFPPSLVFHMSWRC